MAFKVTGRSFRHIKALPSVFTILLMPLLLPSPSNLPFPVFLLLFHTIAVTGSDSQDPAGPPAFPFSSSPLARFLRKLVRVRLRTSTPATGKQGGEGAPATTDAVIWTSADPVRRTRKAAAQDRHPAFLEMGDRVQMVRRQWTGKLLWGKGGLSVAHGGGLRGSCPCRSGQRGGAPAGWVGAGGKKRGRAEGALGAGNNENLTEQKAE